MKTFLPSIKNYTQPQFGVFIKTVKWSGWRPHFITLHNTAAPTLTQWLGDGSNVKHEQRLENIDNLYKNVDHWHSGVHLFIGPEADGIWNPCALNEDGVSVSCWNHVTLGIEMVGNYATKAENVYKNAPAIDDWSSANAQKVRDNAIYAIAVLHVALNLGDPGDYEKGVKGLHFHRECPTDGHNCPGGQVSKPDIIDRVRAKIKELSLTA